ncbi:MAG: hypothetical protein KDE15_03140 [Erythrobacter sp.]|nr:hypothetical protein [Erythrobacter sp.]
MAVVRWHLLALACAAATASCAHLPPAAGSLAALEPTGTVDPAFQSYNVEMVEVTGGRFWAPYGGPAGEVYRQRPAADLANPRLRQLARNLGPVYVRVSGTWANNTYLPAEGETVTAPPAGFQQVLTRDQWRGVVDFTRDVGAQIVTSFAVSGGTRDGDGVWQPEQAQRLLDLTREAGGTIAAAEYFNEPNFAMLGGVPAGYNAADYGRDFGLFHHWARSQAPQMLILGPGSAGEAALVGEGASLPPGSGLLSSESLLDAMHDDVDALSYHHYGAVSQRCGAMMPTVANRDAALTDAWLDRTLLDYRFYAALRDRHAPGKPMWLSETAQAACGGSPWASTFLDSFRYLNQLGSLAQQRVQVVMHNTLAASDYALLDEDSFDPRPNYWAAVLWHRVMGTTVLAPPTGMAPGLRVFAQCLPQGQGGVGLLVLNPTDAAINYDPGQPTRLWLLSPADDQLEDLLVNGHAPQADASGMLSGLDPVASSGPVSIGARSIAFMAVDAAHNPACR